MAILGISVADLVVPTSEAEGTSRACLEALACCRPLLVSDIAAAWEVIADGRDGCLYPIGGHHALAERVLGLLRDGRLPARAREEARASVSDHRLQRSVDMDVQEFRDLLQGRSSAVRPMA